MGEMKWMNTGESEADAPSVPSTHHLAIDVVSENPIIFLAR
jgi:hypothetical protein